MVACMAHDYSIMGICGETKIANKSDSWVTMIKGKKKKFFLNIKIFEFMI